MKTENGKRPKKLLDQVREAIQCKHYSKRTEESYVHWIKRYVLFHSKWHSLEMGAREVEAFLTHLAVKEKVVASTQNQAFGVLLFLYREVLKKGLGDSIHAIRARPAKHLPNVLTKDEVLRVISFLSGTQQLIKMNVRRTWRCVALRDFTILPLLRLPRRRALCALSR